MTACDTLESLKVIGNKNYSKQLTTVKQSLGAPVIPLMELAKILKQKNLI